MIFECAKKKNLSPHFVHLKKFNYQYLEKVNCMPKKERDFYLVLTANVLSYSKISKLNEEQNVGQVFCTHKDQIL